MTLLHGIVKSVISGDTVILRGRQVSGPAPERQLSFDLIVSPHFGRNGSSDEVSGARFGKVAQPHYWM